MDSSISFAGADVSNRVIDSTLAAIDLSAVASHRETEEALEPLSHLLFECAATGQDVDVPPLIAALAVVDPIAAWAATTLERAVHDGFAKAEVRSDVLIMSGSAVHAAAGALAWERWRADHPDDLSEHGVNFSIAPVAKHIARRSTAMLEFPLTAAEAAWAAIAGARRVGLPVGRSAWSYALDGALVGVSEREAEAAREAAQ